MINLLSQSKADLPDETLPNETMMLKHDHILAAIDVGTNSIHMAVVKIQPAIPAFTIIAREKTMVRLGERDPKTGRLTPEAIERAMTALRHCQEMAKSLRAEDIIATATSAVREAPNGHVFLHQIEQELGLVVNLISGQEEARRIYLGVLSGMELNNRPHAIIDIGGGSTELILGDGHEPRSLSSTKIGAVRLTTELVHSDPIGNSEFNYLQAYIRGMMERPVEELLSHIGTGETLQLVGTSGTILTLAEIHAREKLGEVPLSLHGYQFSLRDLRDMINRLRRLNYAERAAIPGMSDRRSEIILAGAMILQETMALLGVDTMTICERALREGIVVDWMLTHGLIEDRLRYQSSVRQRSVLKIAHKYQVNLEHSRHVAGFALELFDQLQGTLHSWSDEERELLWAGAILHNCGHFISHSDHHKHSYYLIRYGELLGYIDVEIETIANLARYHRKGDPKKKHESYRNIDSKKHRRIVEQLSPLLRLAVALDRRQIGAIGQVCCKYLPDTEELWLYLTAVNPEDDCELELWSLDLKKNSFEAAYDLKLVPVLTGVAMKPAKRLTKV